MALLTDRKIKKEDDDDTIMAESSSEYPYGLRIELSSYELEKLGVSKMLNVGELVEVIARGKVISHSMHESEDGEEREHISIQLTDVAIPKRKAKPGLAEKIFGEDSEQA